MRPIIGLTSAIDDDGVIEGYYLPGEHYLRGYQWHPPKTYEVDEYSKIIFGEFISAVNLSRRAQKQDAL